MHLRTVWAAFLILTLLSTAAGISAHESPNLLIYGIWARATAASAPMAGNHQMGNMGANMGEAAPETMSGGHMGSMAMGDVSAAYMTLENRGDMPLRLVAAATDAAGTVEIHETKLEGDVMRMRPVQGGIEIPAGGSVELKPGGLHIMLLELKAPLLPGEAISLKLTFDVLNADGASTGETLAVSVGAPILAEPPAPADIVALFPWARPTSAAAGEGAMGSAMTTPTPGMDGMGGMSMRSDVSAVYTLLLNRGDQPDRLIAAATDAAGTVEIHETKLEGDVMRMRPVEGGIEIPAGGSVELKPGGLHIMLLDLQRDLTPGQAIAVKLIFESGAELTIGVPISEADMNAMPMH